MGGREDVATAIDLLEAHGLALGYLGSSAINVPLRELRIHLQGRPGAYSFDPARQAGLLIGGDKPVMRGSTHHGSGGRTHLERIPR